ncbi:hypothetical protein, partial [Vibrio sp. F13]|uniref:hypothetical protein n=1 Tax=Vibrio sp. F13 TaxID=2070777 RepID=UPI0019D0AAEC
MLLKSSSNKFFLVCLKISFLLILWSFYFGGIIDFRYFELVPLVFIAITFLIFGFLYFYFKNEFFDRDSVILLSLVFVHVFLVSFFGLLFNPGYFYIPSIIYEIYKLYLCLFFLVFLCVKNKSGWVDFFYRTISIFMLANFVVLLLQHIFGVNIINMMGVKYDVSFYQSRGRPTGLTLNANVIGSLSLMFYIFLHYVNEHKDLLYIKGIKYIKLMTLITALCVVLSSSKASFFCLIFFVSISKLRIKNFLFYCVI